MTKKNFFHYYNNLSASDGTLIFFERKDSLYIYPCKHVAPRWCKEGRESKSKGGAQKWRMYIPVAERDKLIAKGAIKVMTAAEFKAIPHRNKGHKCEYFLHVACGLGDYTPDHNRFDKCGDVVINGVAYQVKFQNASLTNVDVLHKAQADARKARKN